MKRWRERIRLKLYNNLALQIQGLLPKDFNPVVDIIPPFKKGDKDLVFIQLRIRIPHELTKKLMWSMKVWRAD